MTRTRGRGGGAAISAAIPSRRRRRRRPRSCSATMWRKTRRRRSSRRSRARRRPPASRAAEPAAPAARRDRRRRVGCPPIVVWFGVVSLLTDVGTEMIYPLLPLFLTDVLHAPRTFVGAVEGAAEATASLLKLVSGRLADRLRRRKPLIVLGYGAVVAGAAARRPGHAAVARSSATRVADRVGKGVRSSPRDALLADAAAAGERGRAYGFHQAMDNAGALVGPVGRHRAARRSASALRSVFLVRRHPRRAGDGGAGLRRARAGARRDGDGRGAARPRRACRSATELRRYLVGVGLFGLGNSSDAFLLLRARAVRRRRQMDPAFVDGAQRHQGGAVDLGRRALRSPRSPSRHHRRLAALRRQLSRLRLRRAAPGRSGRSSSSTASTTRSSRAARRRWSPTWCRRARAGAPSAGSTPSSAWWRCRRRSASARSPIATARALPFTVSAALAAAASLWLALLVRPSRRRWRRRLVDVDLRQLVDARHHHHLDAPVERAPLAVVVVGERVELGVARRRQVPRIDALRPAGSARP